MAATRPVTGPVDASVKIERSRAAISGFLAQQREWLRWAEGALAKGYFIETIGIATNQIHAVLRRGLWLQAQNHSLEEKPDVWNDAYLFDLLQEPSHDKMQDAPDPHLYGAAERFGLIDADTSALLHGLYEEARLTLRAVFSLNAREESHPSLRALAERLLEADTRCLEEVERRFAMFDGKVSALQRILGAR